MAPPADGGRRPASALIASMDVRGSLLESARIAANFAVHLKILKDGLRWVYCDRLDEITRATTAANGRRTKSLFVARYRSPA